MSGALKDLKKSSLKISEDFRSEARTFFSRKSIRERLATSRNIVIDPVSFLIGGIGAVAIGSIADESNEGDHETSSSNSGGALINTALRTMVYPIRAMARFFTGGCIYVVVDSLTLTVMDRHYPLLSGFVTGVCFANGVVYIAKTSVLLGSTIGMALFSLVADFILDKMINRTLFVVG